MLKHIHITLLLLLLTGSYLMGQYTPAEITRLTINPETNQTTIYFTGTDHPDVSFYYVMQLVNQADGIALLNSYTPDVGDMSHVYSVTLDVPEVTTGPVGFYIRPHQDASTPLTTVTSAIRDSTMYLDVQYDWCENSADLSWNGYNRWKDRILHYRVMEQVDGGNPVVVAELPEETTHCHLENIIPGREYLFYVLARRTNLDPDQYVISNGVTLDTLSGTVPERILADFGTVGTDNIVFMQFTFFPDVDSAEFILRRSSLPEGPYSEVVTYPVYLSVVQQDSGQMRNITDEEVDPSVQPYYYKLLYRNACGNEILESDNFAQTICLQGVQNDYQVALNWNPYIGWDQGVAEYIVERSLGDSAFVIIDRVGTTQYTDDLAQLSNEGMGSRVGYRVTAMKNTLDPLASEPVKSVSNQFWINLASDIEFRFNAFTPLGANNNDFGPYMQFLPSGFDFRIYNRKGNVVFHSEDPVNRPRWDGRLPNGTYAPQGVYRYSLRYEDEFGNRAVLQGSVTVVR